MDQEFRKWKYGAIDFAQTVSRTHVEIVDIWNFLVGDNFNTATVQREFYTREMRSPPAFFSILQLL